MDLEKKSDPASEPGVVAKKSGVPIVGGKTYDPENDFADSILRGISKGIARRKERERAAKRELRRK